MKAKPTVIIPDSFVPDPVVCREFDITPMTVWRWDHDPDMAAAGWPAKVVIRNRNFRSREQLEKFKAAIMQKAMANRKREVA